MSQNILPKWQKLAEQVAEWAASPEGQATFDQCSKDARKALAPMLEMQKSPTNFRAEI